MMQTYVRLRLKTEKWAVILLRVTAGLHVTDQAVGLRKGEAAIPAC